MNEPMTFLDFFSGVGGFRKGFELCGMVCKGHCEIDKFADRSYRAIHDIQEDEWYGEDITKIDPADLPRVNLWAGGFPCQDISVSGRQRGLAGERSSLFFEIIRLLKGTKTEDRPEWLVLENVKNLLSVNRGWDFAAVLNSLAEIGYGENNPIVEKSQFIMSLVEQIDKTGVGPQQKSIIDRCTALVYQEAEANGTTATLCNLRNKLLEQPEEKAKEIALSLELFTTGSLDIFGHESTVDLDNRIVVFDIHSLGAQLKPTGLLVITDTILNRVTLNWKKGKRTHIFIDEFHVVFENEQSGIFFNSAWRQFRKRNGYPTAITQNVEYLLDSVQASTMLSNSEFVVMLNQAYSDRAKLSKLLNISDEQMSYVTNADAGCGLIKYGSALVPFINRFPRDTKLYQLMTTKPGEGVFGGNTSN